MAPRSESVFNRLSRYSVTRNSSSVAWRNVGDDQALRKLLRDGIGIRDLQKRYLELCNSSRPSVQPNNDVAQGLGAGQLEWNLTACEKQETLVIAALLTTKEAQSELQSIVIGAGSIGHRYARKRGGTARYLGRRTTSSSGMPRARVLERDSDGEVEVFNALCKALPVLSALRTLEIEGLRKALDKSGAGAARLARGLKGNSKLKALALRSIRLSDSRALGALSSALAGHPSLVALALGHCGIVGETGGRLVSSVIRAHAARREEMVWSAGLRKPSGVVGHTAAAAPARIATAGCLAVDLSGNRLGDVGIHAVARALQSDTWLVGLNLSNNEVTDRGAALLSICLRHNSTLCALVLDGNPAIGQDAEQRIDMELQSRSSMPETILDEPEVVLTLAHWGFTPQLGESADLSGQHPPTPPPPPPPKQVEGDSEMLEISENGNAQAEEGEFEVADSVPIPIGNRHAETNAEQMDNLISKFQCLAGHKSSSPRCSSQPSLTRFAPAAYNKPTSDTTESRAHRTETRPPVATSDDEGWIRARSRSVLSRSRGRTAFEDVPTAARSRSFGPAARGTFTGAALREVAAGSGVRRRRRRQVETTLAERAPWGAGPRDGGARARAHAWADSQLKAFQEKSRSVDKTPVGGYRGGNDVVCCNCNCCDGGVVRYSGKPRDRCTTGRKDRGSGVAAGNRRRARGRKRRGGSVAVSEHLVSSEFTSRRSPKTGGRTRKLGSGRTRRERERGIDNEPDKDEEICVAHPAPSPTGVTPSENDGPGLIPDAASPVVHDDCGNDQSHLLPDSTSQQHDAGPVAAAPAGSERPAYVDRTGKVVSMLAALEEVVASVCQDMWKLEDRVEESVTLANRCRVQDQHQKELRDTVSRVPLSAGMEEDIPAGSYLDDGTQDVAVQVEARLREMWSTMSKNAGDSNQGHSLLASGMGLEEEKAIRDERVYRVAGMRHLGESSVTAVFAEPREEEPIVAVTATTGAAHEIDGEMEYVGQRMEETQFGKRRGRSPRGETKAERPDPAGISGGGWGGSLCDEREGVRIKGVLRVGEQQQQQQRRQESSQQQQYMEEEHREKLGRDSGEGEIVHFPRGRRGAFCPPGASEAVGGVVDVSTAATILFPRASPMELSCASAKRAELGIEEEFGKGEDEGDEEYGDEEYDDEFANNVYDDEEYDDSDENDDVSFDRLLA